MKAIRAIILMTISFWSVLGAIVFNSLEIGIFGFVAGVIAAVLLRQVCNEDAIDEQINEWNKKNKGL